MVEMADIFRSYGKAYLTKYGDRMLPSHKRVMRDVVKCRTSAMGGHVYQCPDHDDERAYKFHSCMNRHCPKCQNNKAQAWLNKERKRLIDVAYFFVTFTLPKELRPIARANQELFYKLMFKTAWNGMKKLAQDPKFAGGLIGALAVLHTWTKMLMYHPHIHFLVPAVAMTQDRSNWLPTQKKFFVPVPALSKIFRAMVRDALKKSDPNLFEAIPSKVWCKNWVVHCKPAGNGDAVLKYFAPYVYRVAISNKRIIKLEHDRVTFVYKHPKTKQYTPVTLHAFEFMRRFLQHVLPKGFKKIRHYGLLSSYYKQALATLQYVLGTVEIDTEEDTSQKSNIPCCPICGKEMILIGIFLPDYYYYYDQLEIQYVPP